MYLGIHHGALMPCVELYSITMLWKFHCALLSPEGVSCDFDKLLIFYPTFLILIAGNYYDCCLPEYALNNTGMCKILEEMIQQISKSV